MDVSQFVDMTCCPKNQDIQPLPTKQPKLQVGDPEVEHFAKGSLRLELQVPTAG